MRDFFKILCVGILVIFAGACSRVANDKTMLSLTLPSTGEGAQSSTQLGYLVVNVSGPGIPKTLVFPFDRHENESVSNSVIIEVPAGEARLVQALAVYFDDATKAMNFYYGDSVASLSGSSSSLVLKVNSISGLENIVSGTVSGRYSASAGVNPTGEVAIKYDPGNSKPLMIVDRGFIVDGWFSLFGLAGVALTYEIESTGQILFGGVPRKLDDSSYFAPAENVLLAQVPIHKRFNGGSTDLEEPQYNVIGWFGSFAATRKVCIPSSGSFSNMKVAGNPATSLSASIDTMSPYITLTNAQMFSQTAGAIQFSGGADEGSCNTANQDISEIFTTISQFDGNGKDTATGFRVPLQKGTDGKFLALPPGGSGFLNISGKVLPGVETVFAGVQFFKKVGPSAHEDEYDSSRPFPCAEMPGRGYVTAGSATISSGTREFLASNVINTAADLSQGGLAVGLCFVDSSGRRVPRGGFIPAYEFSGGSGGMSPATSLSIRMNEGVVPGSSLCHVGEVEYRAANGSFTNGNGATGLMRVLATNGELQFFDESDTSCTSGNSFVDLSSSMTRFRYKAAGTMSLGDTDVVEASIPINGTSISGSLNVKGVAAADMNKLDVFGPAAVSGPNYCKSVQISARNESNGTVATEVANLSLDLMKFDGTGVSTLQIAMYDSNANCLSNTGPVVSATMPLVAGVREIWIKNFVSDQYKLQVGYVSQQSVVFNRVMHLSAMPSGTATKLTLAQLSAPMQRQSGQCQEFQVSTKNDMSTFQSASGLATVNANWGHAAPQLYADPSCTTPLPGGNQLTFSNESQKNFYMKAIHNMSVAQDLNFSANFSFTGGGPMLWSETAGFTNPLPIAPWYLSSNYAGGPMTVGDCYPYTFGFGATTGFTGDRGNFSGDLVTVVLNVPTAPLGTALEIHSNASCTSVIPGGFVDFIVGDQQKTVYLKPLQTFTGGAMTFSSPVFANGLQIGSVGSIIQAP